MKRATTTTLSILFLSTLFLVSLGCREGTSSTDTAETSEDLTEEVSESTTALSTPSSGDPTDNGEVRFTLDGAQWVSGPPGHPEMNFEEEAITDDNTMVRIEALAADGSYLALTVYSESGVGVGTYAITDMGMRGFYKEDFNEADAFMTSGMEDNPGTITISRLTRNEVEGSFQFAMRSSGDPEDIKQVTNGTFSLRFTRI
ncbi:hypothetical protein J1N09_06800 [Aureitalea sp. L0-47]|uniref:DUF6252 family protein n=1 Tax=Aureitalea sp. L0-47 TaxID=2816962 RepID=UPI002238AAB8|nr:DUF6252 family protein [Aureitalea sp. L0-47]MCW5519540.1 hypothetical protein [Aureitalea sp. L0-47]